MSKPNPDIREIGGDRLIDLLQSVDRETFDSDEPHIADDDELLERWRGGQLTDQQHAAALQHLAKCPACTEFVGEWIRETHTPIRPSPPIQTRSSSVGRYLLAFAALATCAALALVAWRYWPATGQAGGDSLLAQGENTQLTHYLDEAEFAKIAAGDYAKGAGAPLILPDVERDAAIAAQQAVLEKEPNAIDARLNLGQLLLEAGKFAAAEEQFQQALDRDPNNPYAQLGAGMARFRLGEVEAAAKIFADLADRSEVRDAARLNRVLCLIALRDSATARQVWDSLPREAQHQRIERVLEALESRSDD